MWYYILLFQLRYSEEKGLKDTLEMISVIIEGAGGSERREGGGEELKEVVG